MASSKHKSKTARMGKTGKEDGCEGGGIGDGEGEGEGDGDGDGDGDGEGLGLGTSGRHVSSHF
tara:strand:+ start:381 stop:569 length:189 start_codon:yes stop_codon:yes gene_type:complete